MLHLLQLLWINSTSTELPPYCSLSFGVHGYGCPCVNSSQANQEYSNMLPPIADWCKCLIKCFRQRAHGGSVKNTKRSWSSHHLATVYVPGCIKERFVSCSGTIWLISSLQFSCSLHLWQSKCMFMQNLLCYIREIYVFSTDMVCLVLRPDTTEPDLRHQAIFLPNVHCIGYTWQPDFFQDLWTSGEILVQYGIASNLLSLSRCFTWCWGSFSPPWDPTSLLPIRHPDQPVMPGPVWT